MKKIYLILVTVFLMNGTIAQWIQQNSGTMNNLSSVYFTDTLTGYAVGDSGTILKTTDGGINWTSQNSGTSIALSSVYFTNEITGVVVGENGTILKTIDGGANWIPKPSGTSYCLSSVHFPKENIGYIVGCKEPDSAFIYKTTDGGETWTKHFWGGSGSLQSVYFPSADTGYACGWWGWPPKSTPIFLKTLNGGIDWINILITLTPALFAVFFTDANIGYIASYPGDYSEVIKTTDGGMSWNSTANTDSVSIINSVYFLNSDIGYAVGYLAASPLTIGVILKTIDAGTNWIVQTSGTGHYLNSVFFPAQNTGYIVGPNGLILKTSNGGGPFGVADHHQNANTLTLCPNPSSVNITIESTKGQLSILNLSGQEFITHQITEPKTQLDISNLPSGVYFVRVTGERTVQVGKFVKN